MPGSPSRSGGARPAGHEAARQAREDRRASRAEITDPEVVLAAAARLLEQRQRSVADLRGRLLAAGYPEALVAVAVDRLLAVGYLDDEAFARAWVESRDRARPRGEHALRRELALRGVDRELVETVLRERRDAARGSGEPSGAGAVSGPGVQPTPPADPQDSIGADEAAARRLVDRRREALERVADPRRRRARAYALLARNGFDPDVCQRVTAEIAAWDSGPGDDAAGSDGEG